MKFHCHLKNESQIELRGMSDKNINGLKVNKDLQIEREKILKSKVNLHYFALIYQSDNKHSFCILYSYIEVLFENLTLQPCATLITIESSSISCSFLTFYIHRQLTN